ncbi:MAG: SGNH/GDSL hydrolase family protein [Planctomycetaceae bacterium]|nr:SGNH/GDSL hydrolase family protein [Planctomycetaceae bacterium]
MKLIRSIIATIVMIVPAIITAEDPPDLRLTLPPVASAIVGAQIGVDFDNIVLTQTPEAYRFVVDCPIGETAAHRWMVTAKETDIGEHPWRVSVWKDDQKLAEKTMVWRVYPATAGNRPEVSLLMVGDSLTNATLYPNDVAKRMSAAGQPKWTMLGTHRPASAAMGVAHEGYGGWTWDRFVRHYESMPDVAMRKFSSPFVFLDSEQSRLDVARYLKDSCDGKSPDYVSFFLGINDCFGANPDDPVVMDAHIDGVFKSAEILIADFRKAAPNADLGICLTTPPNARQAAFEANYQDRYTRWGWKRIQHRLVERQLKQFGGREDDHIFIIPTELNLDPVAGYPENNGVHPNAAGYQQIAASLHAWMTSRWHAPNKLEK